MASAGSDHDSEPTVVIKRAPTPATLSVGDELIGGTYVIEALLGSGGMGEVYRARHADKPTRHAIKVILPEFANDETVVGLFIKEARELERITNDASVRRSTNDAIDAIVRYEGFLHDDKVGRCLVMEFVDGESLGEVLQRRRFEPAEVFALLERLGQGLVAVHEIGIVHRDISPENIILPGGDIGRAKLIDFGIAKSADPSKLTLIGSVALKLSFASPEQAGLFGEAVDHRSDIYSLGLVLAAAALGFGEKLDMGTSLATVIEARQRVPDLGGLPPALRPILTRMLQPRPQDRPDSMRAVLAEARPRTPAPAPARAPTPQRPQLGHPRRFWRVAGWPAGALLAIGAAAAAIVFGAQLMAPSIDQVRVALARAAIGYGCADLSYSIRPDRAVAISGYVRSDQDLARLHDALAGLRGVSKLNFDVRRRAWPYCEALALLKPLLARGNRSASISLWPPGNEAYVGNPLKLEIRAPDFDGHVYVDYFKESGQVVHLFPNDKDRFEFRPARNAFMLGQRPMLSCWNLSGAPGQQLVTLVASRESLFEAARPPVEDARAYLPQLLQALARAAPGQQAAETLFFDLRPGAPPRSPDQRCSAG